MAQADNNIYAPPTPEELTQAKAYRESLYAPPTRDEIAAAKQARDQALYTNQGNPYIQAAVIAGKKFDSYTGAPTRAGIAAAQDVGSLNPADWARAGASGFAKQFGQNPDQAPSGEDIVKKAGVPEGAPSKLAGFAMDIAANPLNFTGPIAGAASKAVNAAREIPYAGEALGAALDFPGNVSAKVASKLTKTPEQAIKIYANDVNPVNQLIQNTGGALSEGADQMKGRILQSVQNEKNALNDQIKTALASADPDRTVSSAPIVDQLEKVKNGINRHTEAGSFSHVQNQIDTIKQLAPNGEMSLQDLFDTKKYLQTQAYGSYKTAGGDLFLVSDDAKRAAKAGLDVARNTLHTEAPAIKDADQAFEFLHNIDDTMSGSLLKQGTSENSFASAGAATDKYANQHASALRKIGEATGTNPLEDAKTVYAAQALNKQPSLAKEALKTALTLRQGVAQSSIPARTYNALQVLGAPDNQLQNQSAIQRRLGSQGR